MLAVIGEIRVKAAHSGPLGDCGVASRSANGGCGRPVFHVEHEAMGGLPKKWLG
jgi:hypothetical protein